ncbi:hypothetical protein H4S02_007377 [Coemansia sp. RSA 2611]|nr:hypothetical protein IWW54_000172 [Coemansia sp. RSA 2705]KAJ2360370.1 hypothetical protein H4S01_005762 [Coemansia sp. RSA 2610]KAJ2378400.1 hypothetical protein H4S02_007377 [Coemansia sp. RSA 2611]
MQEPQQQEGSPGSLRLQRPMMHHELESFKKLQSFVYEYDSYSLPLFAQLHEVSPESTKLSQLECLPIIGNLAVFAILARFIAQSSDFDCLGASTKLKMYGIALMFLVVGFVPFFNVWIVYRTKPLYRCWRLFSQNIGSKGLYPGVSEAGMRIEYVTPNTQGSRPADGSQAHTSYAASTITLNATPPMTGRKPAARATNTPRTDDRHQSGHRPSVHPPAPEPVSSRPRDESRERRGYSSFCPMPTNRNTAAESEFAPNRDTRGDLDYASRDSRFDSQYERMSVGKRLFESMRVSAFPEEADFLKSKYSVRQSALDNWPLK